LLHISSTKTNVSHILQSKCLYTFYSRVVSHKGISTNHLSYYCANAHHIVPPQFKVPPPTPHGHPMFLTLSYTSSTFLTIELSIKSPPSLWASFHPYPLFQWYPQSKNFIKSQYEMLTQHLMHKVPEYL